MPTENDTHEDRALYIAKILKDFCEIHPVIRAPFIAGNYHPLSLAASSEDANFNPEYEE